MSSGGQKGSTGEWRPESLGTAIWRYCGCRSDEDKLPIRSTGHNALVFYGMFCRCLRGPRFLEDIRWDMTGTSLKCCLWDLLKSIDKLLRCSRFFRIASFFAKPLKYVFDGVEHPCCRLSPLPAFDDLDLLKSRCAFYTFEVSTSRPYTPVMLPT